MRSRNEVMELERRFEGTGGEETEAYLEKGREVGDVCDCRLGGDNVGSSV